MKQQGRIYGWRCRLEGRLEGWLEGRGWREPPPGRREVGGHLHQGWRPIRARHTQGVQNKGTSKVYINLSIAADSDKTGHILTNRLPLEVSFKTPGNRTFKRRQLSPKQMIGATENTKMFVFNRQMFT